MHCECDCSWLVGEMRSARKLLVGCWLLYLLSQALAGAPTVRSNNEDIIFIQQDQLLSLTCTVEDPSNSDAVAVWYFNNIPVDTADLVADGPTPPPPVNEGGRLEFIVSKEDSGWYTCSAANEFGRTEKDFLVIVGERPLINVRPVNISVQLGTRVEFPCFAGGLPAPSVVWTDRDNRIIFDGEMDGNYRIDGNTHSLVIANISLREMQRSPYECTISNRFGSVSARASIGQRNPIPSLAPNSSQNIFFSSPFNNEGTSIQILPQVPHELRCLDADISEIMEEDLVLRWRRNGVVIVQPGLNVTITVDGSQPGQDGLYCCEVFRDQGPLWNQYCITVYTQLKGRFDIRPQSASVQTGRSVNLLCVADTPNGYESPFFVWRRNNTMVTNDSFREVLQDSQLFSYLAIRNVQETDSGNYTCTGSNSQPAISETAEVRVVATCNDDNVLNPDWSPSSDIQNQPFVDANNERLFNLSYSTSAGISTSFPTLSQELAFSEEVVSFFVSGRMRGHNTSVQTMAGIPVIRLVGDNGMVLDDLQLPFPEVESWQWVGAGYHGSDVPSELTVVLTVVPRSLGEAAEGVAFFDDVCISLTTEPTEDDNGLSMTMIIIAAGGGAGALLVVAMVILCCCYCCCCRKKSDVQLMKKMTTRLNITSNLSKNRYSAKPHDGIQGNFSQDADGPMYEEVRDQGYYGYYVTPDEYSMANLETQGTGATYTSLDRQAMEKSAEYMVPHTPVSGANTDNYLEVVPSGGGSGSQEYLQLVTGDKTTNGNQSPALDPVTGEIYSYINEEYDK